MREHALVYATVEIKTSLTTKTSREAIQNISSVRTLNYVKTTFVDYSRPRPTSVIPTSPPIGVIFAYNSKTRRDVTLKKWFTPSSDEQAHLFPTLTCCLDFGIMSFRSSEPGKPSAIDLQPNENGNVTLSSYPLVRKKEGKTGEVETIDDLEVFELDEGESRSAQFKEVNGELYPVKRIGKHFIVIDQTRVLMNFMLLLSDILARKRIHPSISFLGTYAKSLDMFRFMI